MKEMCIRDRYPLMNRLTAGVISCAIGVDVTVGLDFDSLCITNFALVPQANNFLDFELADFLHCF